MTPHQILIVAIRVLAIVWLLKTIGHLRVALGLVAVSGPEVQVAPAFVIPILELAACIFLWFFPATVSRRLLRDGDKQVASTEFPLSEWQSTAVVAIGIWTLSYAIPDVIYWLIYVGWYYQHGTDLGYTLKDRWAEVAATAAQMIFGFWLLFGGRSLAATLFRIRTAGLPP